MSKDGRKTHTYRNNLNLWDFFKNMPNLLPEEINIQSLWVFFSNYRQIVEKAFFYLKNATEMIHFITH